ncbi:MAG: response regulator, partial [Proteobacteria bacterium]|nr:response regulator [Pseudomonadota bacterium]
PDGGKIVIKSENVVLDESGLETAGTYVKITVADTGIGMDEDIINRIFDPFFTTKTRGQGTGLGLATAYGIIKSHKGTLKVESKPGKGSAFMFLLPASRIKVNTGKAFEKKKKIFNGKGTVLLVDDERGVIEVCSEMLETLGYQVKAASSGSEAIDVLKNENSQIDLVILDMVMPRMNGQETFDKIRRLDPQMKVLISSGYNRESKIEKMMEKGCNGFILKPFDVATLSEKLKKVFKSQQKEKILQVLAK